MSCLGAMSFDGIGLAVDALHDEPATVSGTEYQVDAVIASAIIGRRQIVPSLLPNRRIGSRDDFQLIDQYRATDQQSSLTLIGSPKT